MSRIAKAIEGHEALESFDIQELYNYAEAIALDDSRAIFFDKIIAYLSKTENVGKIALRKQLKAKAKAGRSQTVEHEAGGWNIPNGYSLKDGMIARQTKDGWQLVCEYCIVDEIHQTSDRKESVISLLFIRRGKRVEIETDEFVENKRLEAKLINHNIFVGDQLLNFKTYLSAFINTNEDSIKKVVLTSSTGWQIIDVVGKDRGKFYSSSELRYCNPITERSIEYVPSIARRIFKEGEGEEAAEILNAALKFRGPGLSVLSSLAAALIYPLQKQGLSNFIVNFAGTTGKGKTLSSRIGLSMYGNAREGDPDSLAGNMNSTSVGAEIRFRTFSDMPVLMDEAGTAKGSAELKARTVLDTIFQFFSGQGRSRATKAVKLREESTFRGVLLLTMEYDLQTIERMANTQEKGYFRRTIEVFSDTDDFMPSKSVYDFGKIDMCFGHIAEGFIASIVPDYTAIKEDYLRFEKELQSSDMRGKEKYFAALWTTLAHLQRIGFITQKTYDEAGRHLRAVYGENLEIMKEITSGAGTTWAYKFIEFIAINESAIETNDHTPKGLKNGFIKYSSPKHGEAPQPEEICIFPSVLDNWLIENGINKKAFIKEMIAAGILTPESKKKVTIKRRGQRVYAFNHLAMSAYDDEGEVGEASEKVAASAPAIEQHTIALVGGQYFDLGDPNVVEKMNKALQACDDRQGFAIDIEKLHDFVIECDENGQPIAVSKIPF